MPSALKRMSTTSRRPQEGLARRLANLPKMRVVRSDVQAVTVELTRGDLLTINNALNEVCHGPDSIDDWEFHTRIGVERHEAKSLLDAVNSLVTGEESGSI
jgi:hypothetical protein